MAQATMTYVLSHITQNIPGEILELAFKPRQYQTSVENRIISEVIEGPVLLDSNLVGGKRTNIFVSAGWKMNLASDPGAAFLAPGLQGAFYKIPPEAREFRNISSVIGVNNSSSSSYPGTNYNGNGSFGNTAEGMLAQMVNTRTFGMTPRSPQITLEGTNVIKIYPEQLIDGTVITVMLEHDSDFINVSNSVIVALRNFCLCATQRYIANKLRVSIDDTEIVAGMEIGVVKEIVNDYLQKAEEYQNLLIRLKGAMTYSTESLSRLIYHAL